MQGTVGPVVSANPRYGPRSMARLSNPEIGSQLQARLNRGLGFRRGATDGLPVPVAVGSDSRTCRGLGCGYLTVLRACGGEGLSTAQPKAASDTGGIAPIKSGERSRESSQAPPLGRGT